MDETTRVQQEAGLTMCGDACTGAGHRIHPIQATVAAGAPGRWLDALALGDGLVIVTLDGELVRLWHHLPLDLAEGEPVAYHPVASVLAVRGVAFNVRSVTA